MRLSEDPTPGATIKVIVEDPQVKKLQSQEESYELSTVITSNPPSAASNPAGPSSIMTSEERRRLYFGKSLSHWGLLMMSFTMVLVGMSSATLLGRLYFVHGGSHRWLYTWTQTAGWPINLVPLLVCYWRGRRGGRGVREAAQAPGSGGGGRGRLLLIYAALGCLTAFDNLLYSWGLSYLPASTNSLICASQLAFNALFAWALVGQQMTAYVVNAVFMITAGAVLLGLHADSDRPAGTTQRQYVLGFLVTIAGSAIYALILPLLELTYLKVLGRSSFVVVVQAQTAISVMATAFSMLGMWADRDYPAIALEASRFALGPRIYGATLAGSAIGWQLFFVGSAGIIFLASSLMSCIFFTATLPVVPVLAVLFFHDSFSPLKAIAMLLSMWGFTSYIYGAYVGSKAQKTIEPDRGPEYHI